MKTVFLTAIAVLGVSAAAALAQSDNQNKTEISKLADEMEFGPAGYTSTDGEVLYQSLCAGCHMPDGGGAVGAGKYPVLKNNPNLEYSAYATSLILNGQKAMPSFGTFLNDEQVVAITDYIQTHLGNDYKTDGTVEAVADFRPEKPDNANTKEHE